MFSQSDKQETNRGFGDGMSRAFELATTPILFGAMGYGIDHWLGTEVAFTVGLATFAVVGTFVRLWYSYDREMRECEAKAPWASRSAERTPADEMSDPVDLWQQRRSAKA